MKHVEKEVKTCLFDSFSTPFQSLSELFGAEVDAITPKRDSVGREMERRIVAQLLTSMDEVQKSNVVVLAATPLGFSRLFDVFWVDFDIF